MDFSTSFQSLVNFSCPFIECLISSAGVCLTYDNDLAIKREDTAWQEGRDVWWQVIFCSIPLILLQHILYFYGISSVLPDTMLECASFFCVSSDHS